MLGENCQNIEFTTAHAFSGVQENDDQQIKKNIRLKFPEFCQIFKLREFLLAISPVFPVPWVPCNSLKWVLIFQNVKKIKYLFKNNDKYCLKNYRPVSILSSVGKIMERVLFNVLFEYYPMF